MNSVSAVDYNYSINYTKLPFSYNQNVVLTYSLNDTITLSYDSWLAGILSYHFNDSSVKNLNVSINIPANTTSNNYTRQFMVNKTISDNNSNGSISVFNFNFNIINDTLINGSLPYISLGVNSFQFNICDWELQYDYDYIFNFSITSNGFDIETLCEHWLSCPDNISFPEGIDTVVSYVNISVPNGTVPGTYHEKALFSLITENNYLNFTFVILDCPEPFVNFSDFLSSTDFANMTAEEIFLAMFRNRMFNETIIIVNETVNHTNTTYVPVYVDGDGNEFSSDMFDLKVFRDLIIEKEKSNREVENDRDAYKESYEELSDERNREINRIPKMINDSVSALMEQNLRLAEEKEHLKNSTVPSWSITLSLIVICLFAAGLFIYIKHGDDLSFDWGE